MRLLGLVDDAVWLVLWGVAVVFACLAVVAWVTRHLGVMEHLLVHLFRLIT